MAYTDKNKTMIILRNKNYSEGDLLKAGMLMTVPIIAFGGATWLANRNANKRRDYYSTGFDPDKQEAYFKSRVGDTGKLLQSNNPLLYNKLKTLPNNYITGNSGAKYPIYTYRSLGKEGYNIYDSKDPVEFHILDENEKGALVVNPNIKNGELYVYDGESGRLKKTTLEKWRK